MTEASADDVVMWVVLEHEAPDGTLVRRSTYGDGAGSRRVIANRIMRRRLAPAAEYLLDAKSVYEETLDVPNPEAALLPGITDNHLTTEDQSDENHGTPEMEFAQSLVHLAPEHLGEPEIDSGKGPKECSCGHGVVEMPNYEHGIM